MCNVAQALEEKGIEKGRKEGVEKVAVNMIRENMDDTLIQKLTGLSAERIAELREQAARKGCSIAQALEEKGIKKGIGKGIGILVRTLKELGLTNEVIVGKLVENFSISETEAKKYL